jgi:hypothetical protein
MIIIFINGNLTRTHLPGNCIFAAREVKEGILFECKWYYNREAVLFSSLLFSSLYLTHLADWRIGFAPGVKNKNK